MALLPKTRTGISNTGPQRKWPNFPFKTLSNLTKTENNEKKQPAYFGDLSFSLCPYLCTRKTTIFPRQF